MKTTESGNALWFILIAVALLAALTAMLTGSADTTEQSGSIEQYRIQASNIMRFSSGIAQEVNRMRVNGTSESVFSFEQPDDPTAFVNPKCDSGECRLFDVAGAGLSYLTPDPQWLDKANSSKPNYGKWEFSGANAVENVETSDPDLIMFVGYLRKPLCQEINIMLDNGFDDNPPTDADGISVTPYVGTFPAEAVINSTGGKRSACVKATAGGSTDRGYVYYQVLSAR